jgi:HTH-type transcriptional regulator/antitoxin HipB
MLFIRSPDDLAVVVKEQRKKLKLSQAEVGDLVGLKQATVSSFENKPEATKLDTLFRMLAALNLEVIVNVRGQSIAEKMEWKEEW